MTLSDWLVLRHPVLGVTWSKSSPRLNAALATTHRTVDPDVIEHAHAAQRVPPLSEMRAVTPYTAPTRHGGPAPTAFMGAIAVRSDPRFRG